MPAAETDKNVQRPQTMLSAAVARRRGYDLLGDCLPAPPPSSSSPPPRSSVKLFSVRRSTNNRKSCDVIGHKRSATVDDDDDDKENALPVPVGKRSASVITWLPPSGLPPASPSLSSTAAAVKDDTPLSVSFEISAEDALVVHSRSTSGFCRSTDADDVDRLFPVSLDDVSAISRVSSSLIPRVDAPPGEPSDVDLALPASGAVKSGDCARRGCCLGQRGSTAPLNGAFCSSFNTDEPAFCSTFNYPLHSTVHFPQQQPDGDESSSGRRQGGVDERVLREIDPNWVRAAAAGMSSKSSPVNISAMADAQMSLFRRRQRRQQQQDERSSLSNEISAVLSDSNNSSGLSWRSATDALCVRCGLFHAASAECRPGGAGFCTSTTKKTPSFPIDGGYRRFSEIVDKTPPSFYVVSEDDSTDLLVTSGRLRRQMGLTRLLEDDDDNSDDGGGGAAPTDDRKHGLVGDAFPPGLDSRRPRPEGCRSAHRLHAADCAFADGSSDLSSDSFNLASRRLSGAVVVEPDVVRRQRYTRRRSSDIAADPADDQFRILPPPLRPKPPPSLSSAANYQQHLSKQTDVWDKRRDPSCQCSELIQGRNSSELKPLEPNSRYRRSSHGHHHRHQCKQQPNHLHQPSAVAAPFRPAPPSYCSTAAAPPAGCSCSTAAAASSSCSYWSTTNVSTSTAAVAGASSCCRDRHQHHSRRRHRRHAGDRVSTATADVNENINREDDDDDSDRLRRRALVRKLRRFSDALYGTAGGIQLKIFGHV